MTYKGFPYIKTSTFLICGKTGVLNVANFKRYFHSSGFWPALRITKFSVLQKCSIAGTHARTVILFMSKEAVSSAGIDGPQVERRISFHSGDRRASRRYRKPSGARSRIGSGDLPKVIQGLSLLLALSTAVLLLCKNK